MTAEGRGHPGTCDVCGSRLKRNGTTSAGRVRWRCTGPSCHRSRTKPRPDLQRRAQFAEFLAWLTGPAPQGATPSERRAFRRRTAWCWNVEPVVPVTGEIYDEVQLDGTYLDNGWCLLAAINGAGTVIAWQWCDEEKTAAWTGLLDRVPPPVVAVVDGGRGLHTALSTSWPTTRVQRCLVHVQRNVRTYLTTHPRTDAGKALRGLSLELTRIKTIEQAIAWRVNLNTWHQLYRPLISEKTYAGTGIMRPNWARANSPWWWTHDRLRKAYNLLALVVRKGSAFTYLDPDHDGLTISSTTNRIEGGTNRQIKDLLRRHRGMTSDHQRRAVEWWLYLHSTNPAPPWTLVKPTHWQPSQPAPVIDDEPIGPAEYDTAFSNNYDENDGIGARRGWGGRST